MSKLYFIDIYVVSRQAKKLSKEFFSKRVCPSSSKHSAAKRKNYDFADVIAK